MTKSARRQDYFQYLCHLARLNEHAGKNYTILAKDLHKMPFRVVLDRDDNRVGDGLELREDYARTYGEHVVYDSMSGCSVLELLLGVAKRMDFELSDPYDANEHVHRYFWELIQNLGLDTYDDDSYFTIGGWFSCKDILDRFVDRNYRRNGQGGLFPLRYPKGDQRCVEIWYQMHAYLEENYDI